MNDEDFKFLDAVGKAVKDVPRGKEITFDCPLCNGQVKAIKSTHNVHVHATCTVCGTRVVS